MSDVQRFLDGPEGQAKNAAIFLSGSGSNAERILEKQQREQNSSLNIVALVTDRPSTSRAEELSETYRIPMIGVDIRKFYRSRGQKRISIMTSEGRAIREEWTNELRRRLAKFNVDFGIFAGFIPLCNLAADFPCLNVHPGDLTYLKNGERHLVGLHTIPIEYAILESIDHLRTSVIIAEPYEGKGKNMDSGHILGVSPKVHIDFMGHSLDELKAIAGERPAKRPVKGYNDKLEEIAKHNQELLKVGGDWVVFPQVVFSFAEGKFGEDAKGRLNYREGNAWTPVQTIEFGEDYATVIP